MKAKLETTCPWCHRRIRLGEDIERMRDGWVHPDCATAIREWAVERLNRRIDEKGTVRAKVPQPCGWCSELISEGAEIKDVEGVPVHGDCADVMQDLAD